MRPRREHFVEDNAEGYKSRRRSLKLWFSPMGKGDAKAGGFLAPKVSACGGRACRLIGRQPEGVLRASGAAAAAAAARGHPLLRCAYRLRCRRRQRAAGCPDARRCAGAVQAIANRIKSKGLTKLRWYCQLCEKACRYCQPTAPARAQGSELGAAGPPRAAGTPRPVAWGAARARRVLC